MNFGSGKYTQVYWGGGLRRAASEMTDEQEKDAGLLARRLQHLYDTVQPEGRKKRYSDADVARAVNEAAGEKLTGRTYLYQLRKGQSRNPTYKLITGLAEFFGVPPTYFFADEGSGLPSELTAALRDDDVRDLALEAAGLSEASRQAIRQMIASARAMENKK